MHERPALPRPPLHIPVRRPITPRVTHGRPASSAGPPTYPSPPGLNAGQRLWPWPLRLPTSRVLPALVAVNPTSLPWATAHWQCPGYLLRHWPVVGQNRGLSTASSVKSIYFDDILEILFHLPLCYTRPNYRFDDINTTPFNTLLSGLCLLPLCYLRR